MNIDLTPLFQAIIILIATIITVKVIPWIKAKNAQADQETAQKRWEMMQATIRVLVFAAEQLYGAGAGYEKLEYVKQELEKRGFTVDPAAIEGAVAELLNYTPVTQIEITEEHPPEELNDEDRDD